MVAVRERGALGHVSTVELRRTSLVIVPFRNQMARVKSKVLEKERLRMAVHFCRGLVGGRT